MRKLHAAFRHGKTRPIEFRKQQLHRLHALVKENEDAIIGALQEDLGKVNHGLFGVFGGTKQHCRIFPVGLKVNFTLTSIIVFDIDDS